VAAEKNNGALAHTRADVETLIRDLFEARSMAVDATERASRDQRKLLLELLEVLDHFDRLFENIAPKEATADRLARIWVGNFRSVRNGLEKRLQEFGVARYQSPENKVVPGYHVVVETRESAETDDGTIAEERKKGYLWHGAVLRKAEVVAIRKS
jgi:molecular chaperone GrpE (heat shock protein)